MSEQTMQQQQPSEQPNLSIIPQIHVNADESILNNNNNNTNSTSSPSTQATTPAATSPITMNQDQHECLHSRERRHDRNVSFRHRRQQDLSPRFEDDRNIIYLNDATSRYYRSQNQLNDPSGYLFQRSASARNIRLRSGISHNHLHHQLNLHVDDRLTNQIRRSFQDRTNGLSQDTLIERQNLVLVPMYGLLRPRRSRNRSHRLSADLENSQRRQTELIDVSTCRNLNNSLSTSPLNEDTVDRPIIFTNPTGRNHHHHHHPQQPQQPQALSLNTAQTLSLRSPNETDLNEHNSPSSTRSQSRINPIQPSTRVTTQAVQTRGLYQGQLRRVQNESIIAQNRHSDESDALVMNIASSNTNRLSTMQQCDNGSTNLNNTNNSNRDREIYVLRNNNNNTNQQPSSSNQPYPLLSTTVDNASMTTTSISDASSIEDLHVTEIVANSSYTDTVIHRPKLYEGGNNSETEKLLKRQDVKYAEKRTDSTDWRANLIGSRQLWREMLITERFADVWFIVGGEDILGNNGTLSLYSSDSSAPGGPTSQLNCCSTTKQLFNISSTRTTNYTNSFNKSRLICNNNNENNNNNNNSNGNGSSNPPTTVTITARTTTTTNTTSSTTSSTTANNNNNNNSNHPTDNILLHSKCTNSDQENNTIDDATDLNSDSEHLSCHSDHINTTDTNKSTTLTSQSTNCHSQMIRLKDEKNSIKMNHVNVNKSMIHHQLNATQPLNDVNEPGALTNNNETEPLVWRFAAHRLILAAASPVFEAMFYGPMADCENKNLENRREYHIPDIHPKAFQIMLSYIYSDELLFENDINLLFYVLYATKKYILPRLTQICVESLKDLITAENVCMMLDRSIFFDEVDLTRRCWHVIDVLAPDVLSSQGLLTLNANCLHDLVSRNTLNCQESEVFAAVGRWAGAECNRLGIRDVVSNRVQVAANILPLIRFPTMTLSDFAENVAYSGYLSLEMVRDLFVYITTNKLTTQNKDLQSSSTRRSNSLAVKKPIHPNESLVVNEPSVTNPSDTSNSLHLPLQSTQISNNNNNSNSLLPDSGPFPREPRIGPKLWRCCRFKRIRKDLLSLTTSTHHRHTISFSVSASIFIAGVGIYGSTQVGDTRTVQLELRSGNGSVPLHSPVHITSPPPPPQPPRGTYMSDRMYFSHASRSTSDLTSLNASTRLFNHNNNTTNTTNNSNNNRVGYSNNWDISTGLSRLDETDSPSNILFQSSSNHLSNKKRSTKCLASKKILLQSDGTNRVYDIRFECPVKLVKNRRYYLSLNTSNGDHNKPVSMSTSSTAINSSTSYIGFYGGTEIMIHCPSEETLRTRQDNETTTNVNNTNKKCSSSSNIRKKRTTDTHKLSFITNNNFNDNHVYLTGGNNETVVFNFHDSWDGLENGNVDRGLIPDLLFYTCF
ncbi:unnamed protein product [Schistosoma turkestanicum]|nr:unnamed protein product [Schistosoma turkestanicum]